MAGTLIGDKAGTELQQVCVNPAEEREDSTGEGHGVQGTGTERVEVNLLSISMGEADAVEGERTSEEEEEGNGRAPDNGDNMTPSTIGDVDAVMIGEDEGEMLGKTACSLCNWASVSRKHLLHIDLVQSITNIIAITVPTTLQ